MGSEDGAETINTPFGDSILPELASVGGRVVPPACPPPPEQRPAAEPRSGPALSSRPPSAGHAGLSSGALLLLAAGAALLLAAADGASGPPLRDGLAYGEARRLLLAAGWRPARLQPLADCESNGPDRRCRLFGELRSCSHTGAGLCRFEWRSPQGRLYAVITRNGDPDGRPGLVNTWFRAD